MNAQESEPGNAAATGTVEIREIALGDPRIKEFAKFPWRLYRDDPNWTPPLMADLLGNKLLGAKGLLTADHPYHRTAEVTHFMAYRDGEPVGRVSAAVNQRFNDYYDARIGFFGFFDAIEDQSVANALLDAAKAWLKGKGMDTFRGPGEYSNATHERQAVLIDGYDTPPTVELTHNHPYYGTLLEGYGLAKVKDYHAYWLDVQAPLGPRLAKVAEQIKNRRGIVTRPCDMSRFQDDVRLIIGIYNQAWAQNWGFLPLTEAEADVLAESLKPIVDPGLIRFAFIDDEPVAVIGTFPDPNCAFLPRWKWYGDSDLARIVRLFATRRKLPRVRLMFFGIVPGYRRLGVDAVLFKEIHDYANAGGYKGCDISMLLEDNDLVLRASSFMGAHQYKTWRIYEMPIA